MPFSFPYGGGGQLSPLGALSTQKEVDADAGLFALIVAAMAIMVFTGSGNDIYAVRSQQPGVPNRGLRRR